jgi:hypothetical protein
MGVIGERYAQHQGGARGAPHAQSKRQRLDVGVLPYFFVLFLLDEAGYFLSSFIGWFLGLVGSLRYYFRSLVKSWCYGSLVESLDLGSSVICLSRLLGSSGGSSFELSLVAGGVEC